MNIYTPLKMIQALVVMLLLSSCFGEPNPDPTLTATNTSTQIQLDSDYDGVMDNVDACPNSTIGSIVNTQGCEASSASDSDDDGIPDLSDQCPNTIKHSNVNSQGCADSDNDGIADTDDACANTAQNSNINVHGCPDSDDDGIADLVDVCPNTPSNSNVDIQGCALVLDSDNDNIPDHSDACPTTPIGSMVDARGCIVNPNTDSDADGISNDLDQCPNTPTHTIVDTNGCKINEVLDSDQDGINNDSDQCPNTPLDEMANLDGCSDIQIGERFYKDDSQSCVACHGGSGLGKNDPVAGAFDAPLNICSLIDCTDLTQLTNYMQTDMPKGATDKCTVANGCADNIAKYMIKHIVEPAKDADNDGIFDNIDQCLNTTQGQSVNDLGCALYQLDTDLDGVNDQLDQCADTAFGSTVDSDGCPEITSEEGDDDNDNVLNKNDQCINTPADFKNDVDSDGCSSFDRGFAKYFDKLNGVNSCADCHGNAGQGAQGGGPINKVCTNVDCQNTQSLSIYLDEKMPYGNVMLCENNSNSTCAFDIATYMQEAFYTSSEDYDNDGILNSVDACPNTDSSNIQSIDHTGCTNTNLLTSTIIAINAGGSEYLALDGTRYLADDTEYFDGSKGYTIADNQNAIDNTQDDVLYRNERWGKPLTYKLPVPTSGKYTLELHLAEVYHEENGKRVMSVTVEGDEKLSNFDIHKESGGKNVAVVRTFDNIQVDDGIMTIVLSASTDNASVVALKVTGSTQNDGDRDGIADKLDFCPGTQLNTNVNEEGCSDKQRDSDNDTVLEPLDMCPKTPADQTHSVENTGQLAGCSLEERSVNTDGDDIPDVIDHCPNTPEGVKVGVTGCSENSNLPLSKVISPQMRLTSVEYSNVVKKAFNINALPSLTFQGDIKGPFGLFSNNGADLSGDFTQLVEAAITLGNELAPDLVDNCNWLDTPQNCVNQHLSAPMKSLYRQDTLSSEDIAQIVSVINYSKNEDASEVQALSTGIARVLIDDRTVYQIELGLNSSASGKIQLTGSEYIDRMSFALLNNTPDVDFALNAGDINDTQSIQAQISRLMHEDNYKENIWLFVADWLNISSTAGSDMSKIENAAIEESRRLVYHIIENDLPITEIFTANYSFINAVLADHYGVSQPNNDWDKYTFNNADQRKGILTHASFLMQTGGHGRDVNTIFRGKVVYEGLFCKTMPPPPAASESTELAGEVSDRGVHPKCAGCHSQVDPIGRMFDRYDDDGKVFNDLEFHGGLYMDVDIANQYDSVVDFVSQIPNSGSFKHCVARQLFRFALGRDANESERASFDALRNSLDDANRSFDTAMNTLLISDSFKHVHTTQDLSCSAEN